MNLPEIYTLRVHVTCGMLSHLKVNFHEQSVLLIVSVRNLILVTHVVRTIILIGYTDPDS